MKVRMIFAHEYLPEGATERVLLKVDSRQDLDPDLAQQLIAEGRAEAVADEPPAPKGKAAPVK